MRTLILLPRLISLSLNHSLLQGHTLPFFALPLNDTAICETFPGLGLYPRIMCPEIFGTLWYQLRSCGCEYDLWFQICPRTIPVAYTKPLRTGQHLPGILIFVRNLELMLLMVFKRPGWSCFLDNHLILSTASLRVKTLWEMWRPQELSLSDRQG